MMFIYENKEKIENPGIILYLVLLLASAIVGFILGFTVLSGKAAVILGGFVLRLLTYRIKNSVQLIVTIGIGLGLGAFLNWNYLYSYLEAYYYLSPGFFFYNSTAFLFLISAGMADLYKLYGPQIKEELNH